MKTKLSIVTFIILTTGIIFYFAGYELKWMITDKLDNLFFYPICAGISLMSYCLIGTLDNIGNYLMRALCIYFIILFIMFGLDEIMFFDIKTKWVYIPTGGLVICLALSAIWHWVRLQK
jgi:hypothetical protein